MVVLFQQSNALYSSVELYGLVVLSRLVRATALANIFKALFMAKSLHNATLSCLVVQPFLLAMPADMRLAIKA